MPPCQRCVRQNLKCILAPSRRGGRRVRKSAKLSPAPDADSESELPVTRPARPLGASRSQSLALQDHSHDRNDWASTSPPQDWPATESEPPNATEHFTRGKSPDLEGHMTSADLLNPSDALNLLAQVADTDEHRGALPAQSKTRRDTQTHEAAQDRMDYLAPHQYPPLTENALTLSDISFLVHKYAGWFPPSSSPSLC